MTTTTTVRRLLAILRGIAVEIAYGLNAGAAIRHGQTPPPPPRTSRDTCQVQRF